MDKKKWTWERKILLLFSLIFVLKGAFYNLYAIPRHLGVTPDDVGHFSYVVWLYTEHTVPDWETATMEQTASRNNEDAFAGVMEEAASYQLALGDGYQATESKNWISHHPPLYYLYLLPFFSLTALWTDQLSVFLMVMRFATTLLGLGTLWLLWAVCRRTNMSRTGECCAMIGFVFFHALQYSFSAINNDAMAIFTSSLAFYFFLRYMERGQKRFLFAFAVSAGLIFCAKYNSVIVLPVYALAFLAEEIIVRKTPFRKWAGRALASLVLFTAVCAPLLVQNYARYGRLVSITAAAFPAGSLFSLPVLSTAHAESAAAAAGLGETLFGKYHYASLLGRALVSLTGWRSQVSAGPAELWLAAVCLWLACAARAYLFVRSAGVDSKPGRGKRLLSAGLLLLFPPLAAGVCAALWRDSYVCFFGFLSGLSLLVLAPLSRADDRRSLNFRLCLLSAGAVAFYMLLILGVKHIPRAMSGASTISWIMGRYYYPLILPFLFLLGDSAGNAARRRRSGPCGAASRWVGKALPLLLLLGACASEIDLVTRGMMQW